MSIYQSSPRLSNKTFSPGKKSAILKIPSTTVFDRPSIVEVVSGYGSLRRTGKEFIGLCPFHVEKHPSFYVNPDKGFFYCFGCAEGGDVISFVRKIEKLSFKEALAHLGIASTVCRPPHEDISKKRELHTASQALEDWALTMTRRISSRMRVIGQRMFLARITLEYLGQDETCRLELERATREWEILETLQDNLVDLNELVDLWRQRDALENLIADLDDDSPAAGLPELTPPYRHQLRNHIA